MTSVLSNWHFMRIMRAVMAVWIIHEGWTSGQSLLFLPGAIFAMQAIFDIGCCGASGCTVPRPMKQSSVDPIKEDVFFEEVK